MSRSATAARLDNHSDQEIAGAAQFEGRFSRRSMVHLELEDGLTVIAPEEVIFRKGAMSDIGDIVDIVCKVTGWCGGKDGGGGGGGDGCTTITIQNPDGSSTTIKTCPPKGSIA